MIFKKPYAFLIKNFKIIHIILTVLTIFIAIQSHEILSFFRTFITNGYSVTVIENIASNYIHPLIYFSIILVIIISSTIFVLLKTKDKPNKAYLFTIIYYVLLLIFIMVAYFLINSLENGLWATADARTYRDFAQLIYYPQLIFIIIFGITALGFDVKKFNFKKDLKELEITEADSEEIELNINFETYKVERLIRRFFREFKYYFLENKLIVMVIGLILILIFGFLIFKNYEKVKYTFNEGSSFVYKTFNIKVEDSIITNVDLAGNQVYKDKVFVVIKIKIKNSSIEDKTIDYNNFKLYFDNEYVYPSLDLGNYFLDYGNPYMGDIIKAKDEKTYIIPYLIDVNNANKNYFISIYTGTAKKTDKFMAKTITIRLKPIKYNNVEVVRNANVGEAVSLSSTLLKDTLLTIRNAEFITRYEYQYQSCYQDNCRTFTDVVVADTSYQNKQTLIVMDYEYLPDKEAAAYQNINNISRFASSFMKVRYTLAGITKEVEAKYVTPTRINDKIILQTSGYILGAEKVELLITIRNRCYIINLK